MKTSNRNKELKGYDATLEPININFELKSLRDNNCHETHILTFVAVSIVLEATLFGLAMGTHLEWNRKRSWWFKKLVG